MDLSAQTQPIVLSGADIFDGNALLEGQALVLEAGKISLCKRGEVPADMALHTLKGGTLLPKFVDLQVNGGGGIMFNAAPSLDTLECMAKAHAGLGTAAFLPTLITDTPDKTRAAIDAVQRAIAEGVKEIIGLHLEGPHLAVSRKGAHAANLIRPMCAQDLSVLRQAGDALPNLMVTLAPETVNLEQIQELTGAGIIVSLGHSDCTYDVAMAAFDAGALCTTHLFNAMSQLGSRAPGLVGAALNSTGFAGLIADGIHVAPATIKAALAANTGPGEIFLVTDAMACAGSESQKFELNGREIRRADGRLTLADGTLAGADLSMARAVQVMIQEVGDVPAKAMARATSIPASILRETFGYGVLPSTLAELNYLNAELELVDLTRLFDKD